MDNTAAFRTGQIVGELLGLAIVVGYFAFFGLALTRAIRTGRKGWIVGAAISGLPLAALVLAFVYGVVIGIARNAGQGPSFFNTRSQTKADFLTASMTPVTGSNVPYQISFPWINLWKKLDTSTQPFDQFYTYRDAYVAVIAEGIGVGTPRRACDISQQNLAAKASQHHFTTPATIIIDSRHWLTYDATTVLNGINIKYRFFVYADPMYTIQIVTWAGLGDFPADAALFDRIARSFKFAGTAT